MATNVKGTKIPGKELLWRIKRPSDTGYMLVACQSNLDFPLSRNFNSEETKCGMDKSSGALDANATVEGTAMVNIDAGANALSYNELAQLIIDDTEFDSEFSDEDGGIYVAGKTKLQQISLGADTGTNVKFTANIEFMNPQDIDLTQTT